jgi:hypothetical protein
VRQREEIQVLLRRRVATPLIRPGMDEVLEGLSPFVQSEVARYLATGDHETMCAGWPGQNFLEIATRADRILRSALVAQVLARSQAVEVALTLSAEEIVAMTRRKVEPDGARTLPQKRS